MAKQSLISEFWEFLKVRKRFWLLPIIIMLSKNDSPVISTIAKQALFLNIFTILFSVVALILAFTIIGIPLAIVIIAVSWLASVILPIVGAVKAADGKYYRYPIVGIYPD